MNPFQPNNSNIFGQQQNQQQGQQGTPFNAPFGQQQPAAPFNAAGANTAFSTGAQPFGAPGLSSQQGSIFSTGSVPFNQTSNAGLSGSAFGSANTGAASFGQGTAGNLFGQNTNTANLFGQNSAQPAFGQNNVQPAFGQNNAQPAFGQNNAQTAFGQGTTPFGQGNASNTLFGQGTTPFGQSNAANTPFWQNNTANTSFGQNNAPPAFGQNNTQSVFGQNNTASTPFGQNSAAPPSSNIFGSTAFAPGITPSQGSNNNLGTAAPSSQQAGQQMSTISQKAASSFTNEPSVFTTQASAETTEPSVFSTNATSAFTAGENEASIDQSCLMSSIKDNSVNLYNLTLQEIIDMQASTLDRNIKEFRRDAQAVFEQDMRLIRAKNHYVELQKSIERESLRMDELSELIDYLEKHLDSLPVGDETEVGQCVGEFEHIVDRFYDKVQRTKDEQGEVLNILNENYELIEAIDRKLDSLEDFTSLK